MDPDLFERKKGLLEVMGGLGKDHQVAGDSVRRAAGDWFGVDLKAPPQEEFNLLKRPAPAGGAKGGPKKKKQKTKK